jgi:hypothetical protein
MLDDAVPVGLVGSLGIFDRVSEDIISAVGLGIKSVRSGIVLALPPVSKLVTMLPVILGLELVAEGGICITAEDVVTVMTPIGS